MLHNVKRKCIFAFHSIFRSSFIFILWSLISINNNNNNRGCSCNCRPEPEFIEEIVGTIWKILYGESPTSTIPPWRQNDVPGQYASLIIPQKSLAERTHLFFFSNKKKPSINKLHLDQQNKRLDSNMCNYVVSFQSLLSKIILSLSPLSLTISDLRWCLPFADPARHRSLPLHRRSLPLRRWSVLFVVDLRSSSATSQFVFASISQIRSFYFIS